MMKARILTPEERNDCYDSAHERWKMDGKTELYEFAFLWQYIAYEVAKAQAEISFKAGQKDVCTVPVSKFIEQGKAMGRGEVVECGNKLLDNYPQAASFWMEVVSQSLMGKPN